MAKKVKKNAWFIEREKYFLEKYGKIIEFLFDNEDKNYLIVEKGSIKLDYDRFEKVNFVHETNKIKELKNEKKRF